MTEIGELHRCLLGSTAIVVASDAPDEIIQAAQTLKATMGDLIQICDGTADDVQIQAAIDALPAGGGKVVTSAGTFYISTAIDLVSDITLDCNRSLFQVSAASPINACFQIHDIDNVTISGAYINGFLTTHRFTYGIDIQRSYQVIVENCNIINCGDDCIAMIDTYDTLINKNYVGGTSNESGSISESGIEVQQGSYRVTISNNICADREYGINSHNYADGSHPLYADYVTTDVNIVNNIIQGATIVGIWGISTERFNVSNNIISDVPIGVLWEAAVGGSINNNTISDYTNTGISIANLSTYLTISNNEISGNYTGMDIQGQYINIIGGTIKGDQSITDAAGISLGSTGQYISVDSVSITGYDRGIKFTIPNVTIRNCTITGAKYMGIQTSSTTKSLIDSNYIYNNGVRGIDLSGTSAVTYVTVQNNICYGTGTQQYGIEERNSNSNYNIIRNNHCYGNTAAQIAFVGANTKVSGNIGYIAPGEVRTVSGTLTGGAANAILFAQQNPEAQDCFVMKVVINITTADADAANIDCGIADDASYTNGGTEFFDDLAGETAQLNDSWVVGDGGQQTKWVLWQDNASATDDWVTAKILDNDGSSIVGSYYIQYCGK